MKRFFFCSIVFLLLGNVFLMPFTIFARGTESLKNQLSRQLAEIDRQTVIYRNEIHQLGEKNLTLKEELKLLGAEEEKNKLQIKALELTLANLQKESSALRLEIEGMNQKIFQSKQLLSKSLRSIYQEDTRSFIEALFSDAGFSGFFDQVAYKQNLQRSIQSALAATLEQKKTIDAENEELDGRLASQGRLLALQELGHRNLISVQERKAKVIQENLSTSFTFEQKDRALQEVAAQLRQRLYILHGLAKSVDLDEALAKAKNVAEKVSINPLFLMAILKVESDIGNNIGGGNWRTDMHPRDREAFLRITQKLGLDPDAAPVSSKPSYGWGGAIGPAQFLPATWLSYEQEVSVVTGHNPPNPWDLADAFAAAAIKLSRGGAGSQTYEGEWEAAMKYFAGGNWRNPAYSFYADRVMDIKTIIAAQAVKA